TDITQLKEEYMQLVNEIEDLNEILSDPKRLRRVMIDELREVKKTFATPRRTQIESQIEEIVIDQKQMIPSEQVMCTISRDGYAKRVSLRSYNASSEAISGCKDGDVLIGYREVNTLDTLLFFTETETAICRSMSWRMQSGRTWGHTSVPASASPLRRRSCLPASSPALIRRATSSR
ncbi:MAG: hypothetical protein ACLVJ6_17195, partial [Merdibacter sp.]